MHYWALVPSTLLIDTKALYSLCNVYTGTNKVINIINPLVPSVAKWQPALKGDLGFPYKLYISIEYYYL